MTDWFDLWRNLTSGQGTLLGGAFVLCAAFLTFGTGSLDRRSRAKRQFYEEMKALYAEALRIGRDLELLKAVPPEGRHKIITEKVDAMQKVISELALTGNYQTAHIAIAYTYQQSVQLATWARDVENDIGWPDQFRKWLDNMTDQDLTALKEYRHVRIDRRHVVEALRGELALYVPRCSRQRRVMRRRIRVERYGLN
jgi:hypothetical protein